MHGALDGGDDGAVPVLQASRNVVQVPDAGVVPRLPVQERGGVCGGKMKTPLLRGANVKRARRWNALPLFYHEKGIRMKKTRAFDEESVSHGGD